MLAYWLLKRNFIFTYQYTWPFKFAVCFSMMSTDNDIILLTDNLATQGLLSFLLKLCIFFHHERDFLWVKF